MRKISKRRVVVEERTLLDLLGTLLDSEVKEFAESKHLDEKEFQYHLSSLGEYRGRTLFEIDDHLDACCVCQEAIKAPETHIVVEESTLLGLFGALVGPEIAGSIERNHLGEQDFQRYLGNTDGHRGRTLFEIDEHLDTCHSCREAIDYFIVEVSGVPKRDSAHASDESEWPSAPLSIYRGSEVPDESEQQMATACRLQSPDNSSGRSGLALLSLQIPAMNKDKIPAPNFAPSTVTKALATSMTARGPPETAGEAKPEEPGYVTGFILARLASRS